MVKGKKIKVLFFILLTYVLLIKVQLSSGNETSRFATIQSLVEEGTFIIDNSMFLITNDKAFVNGHFYSNKPAILSVLGAGIYWIFYNILGVTLKSNPSIIIFFITLILIAIPTIIMLCFFYKSLDLLKIKENHQHLLVLTLAFATLMFPYSLVFNNHTTAGVSIFIAFYFMIKNKFEPLTKNSFFLMGFFVALAMAIDLVVGGAFLAVFSVYILFTERKNMFYYLLGALIPIILYSILSIAVTGDLLPASMHPEYFKYDGSDFLNERDMAGVARPNSITGFFVHAFHSLFGYRGLFSYTPLFFISAYCLYNLLMRKDILFHESLACFFAISIAILFYLYTDSVYGGYAYGMRYFVAFHPVLFFFTIFYFKELTAKKMRLYYILLAISIFITIVGVYDPWADSFGYPFFWDQPVPFLNNLRFMMEGLLRFMSPELLDKIKELI